MGRLTWPIEITHGIRGEGKVEAWSESGRTQSGIGLDKGRGKGRDIRLMGSNIQEQT